MIANNYEILFSRSSPADVNKFVLDVMPAEMNWIAMVDRLSNGDITKHKQIYETNYIECLNLMAYWHFKDKQIEQINRVMERKYKKQ